MNKKKIFNVVVSILILQVITLGFVIYFDNPYYNVVIFGLYFFFTIGITYYFVEYKKY